MSLPETTYFDFLTTLYYERTNQLFPELLMADASESEEITKLLENALKENRIISYEEIVKALKIDESQYDLSIDGSKMSK